jgi:hypothetical protein
LLRDHEDIRDGVGLHPAPTDIDIAHGRMSALSRNIKSNVDLFFWRIGWDNEFG